MVQIVLFDDSQYHVRIYHPWYKWEDYQHGFYNNCHASERGDKIDSVIRMFNCESSTRIYMTKVIESWVFSCEHNLTNTNMNRVAWLGQAACCLYDSIPSTITMEAWNLLPADIQDRSDSIAMEVISKWEKQRN